MDEIMEKVINEDRIKHAKVMIEDKLPLEAISRYSGLSVEAVKNLIDEMEKEKEIQREKIPEFFTNLEDWLQELVQEDCVDNAIKLIMDKQLSVDDIALKSGLSVEVVQTLIKIMEECNERHFKKYYDDMESWLLQVSASSAYKMYFVIAKNLIKSGNTVENAAEITGLPIEIVKKIAAAINRNC